MKTTIGNNIQPMKHILVIEPFARVEIDIVRPLKQMMNDLRTALTKWMEL